MPNAKPPRVLLVEDDTVLSNLLFKQFEHQGVECVVAGSAEDGLQFLKTDQNYSVILLDISLPGMDGFEMLSMVKKDPAVAAIPVVIVSNFSQEKDIEWGKKLGAVKFMSKVSVVPADIVAAALELGNITSY